MRISDWSSDVCSSDLEQAERQQHHRGHRHLDAIVAEGPGHPGQPAAGEGDGKEERGIDDRADGRGHQRRAPPRPCAQAVERSEEHTSELQSLMRISYAVFCLKKKKKPTLSAPRPHQTNRSYHTNTTDPT